MIRLNAQQPGPPEPAHTQCAPARQPVVLFAPGRYADRVQAIFTDMHAYRHDFLAPSPLRSDPLSTMAGFASLQIPIAHHPD
jgi:hypothetical protein